MTTETILLLTSISLLCYSIFVTYWLIKFGKLLDEKDEYISPLKGDDFDIDKRAASRCVPVERVSEPFDLIVGTKGDFDSTENLAKAFYTPEMGEMTKGEKEYYESKELRPGVGSKEIKVKIDKDWMGTPEKALEIMNEIANEVLPGNSNPQAVMLEIPMEELKDCCLQPEPEKPLVKEEVMSGVLNILDSIKESKSIKKKLDKDELDFFNGLVMKDGKIVKKTSN